MTKNVSNGFNAIIAMSVLIVLTLSHCKTNPAPTLKSKPIVQNVSDVVFFVENSGSMFGYVNKSNEFKRTVVGLAYLPDFDTVPKSFYFINGTTNPSKRSQIHINYIGNDPEIYKINLSPASFNIGDIRYSDLNKMFEIALDSAKENRISVLISDCIYDVGEESDPLTALGIESEGTQQAFRTRLSSENIQTIIIKATSIFEGGYYYASKKGSTALSNTSRPYYVFFFGKAELLNRVLTEQDLSEKVAGPYEITRFFVNEEKEPPFQIVTSQSISGDFQVDYNDEHKLIRAKPFHGKFQFAIAVDLSSLSFSEAYLQDISNYECLNSNFEITSVSRILKKIPGVSGTHLITLFTDKNPVGKLNVVIKNSVPDWIFETDSDNENQIDSFHTYGFGSLMKAIRGAYDYKNRGTYPASLSIEITN